MPKYFIEDIPCVWLYNITYYDIHRIFQEDNYITCLIDDGVVNNNNNEGTDLSKSNLRHSIESLNNDVDETSIVNGITTNNKRKFEDLRIEEEEDCLQKNIKKEVVDAEEYIDVDEDSDCPVENKRVSPHVEKNMDYIRANCVSNVKLEPDVSPIEVLVKKEILGDNARVETETDEQSRYCTTCDITFTYPSSLIAHKKFYCPKVKV